MLYALCVCIKLQIRTKKRKGKETFDSEIVASEKRTELSFDLEWNCRSGDPEERESERDDDEWGKEWRRMKAMEKSFAGGYSWKLLSSLHSSHLNRLWWTMFARRTGRKKLSERWKWNDANVWIGEQLNDIASRNATQLQPSMRCHAKISSFFFNLITQSETSSSFAGPSLISFVC